MLLFVKPVAASSVWHSAPGPSPRRATGDPSVQDVATELQRAGVKTGETRLFRELN
jgi:hypothetical protein